MDVNQSLALLGGLSPAQFMRRHWQKNPLLVRQAVPAMSPLLSRAELFALASGDAVESRLIEKRGSSWRMQPGPISAGKRPAFGQPGWTLLVQGVDLHHPQAHQLMRQFRFVPDARLDDLMISWASEGGGVGPHVDSYDVFLLQSSGRRRWRFGRQKDLSLQPDVPLKILQHFDPEAEFVLDAGDMLYLPPGYAHDGVAETSVDARGRAAECMTCSIGFRAPDRSGLAAQLFGRLADFGEDDVAAQVTGRYRDPMQRATAAPAHIPASLNEFAAQALARALRDPLALPCALGEMLTEPKASVYFDARDPQRAADLWPGAIALDAKTRMMYDSHHVFVNGESYRAKGADARLMRALADQRELSAAQLRNAGDDALALLADWYAAGWLHRTDTVQCTAGEAAAVPSKRGAAAW